MTLAGKGYMIWKIPGCEKGDPQAISAAAVKAGLTHVLIKIADGILPYNIDKTTKTDLVPPVVQALRSSGQQVWGWHYIYGRDPIKEARIAADRVKELKMDGYVLDAEDEYKQPGMARAASAFMTELRKDLPQTPIALSSFRFPTFHPQLPWKEFLSQCDYNMPQVYWQNNHNPASQLVRTVNEFQALNPFRPIIPTGPVYKAFGWVPTPQDITVFLTTARQLNLPAANFFAWDYGCTGLSSLWDAAASFSWDATLNSRDIPEIYIEALNTHEADRVAVLYNPNGVHITAEKTIQGSSAIQSWYLNFLNQVLPNAVFRLTSTSGNGDSRQFTWEADSPVGRVINGSDTFGLNNNFIAYHFSQFNILPH